MITIARPIGETTLNGLEWLLNRDGSIMKFESEEEAKKFLRTNGFKKLTDEALENSCIFEEEDDK